MSETNQSDNPTFYVYEDRTAGIKPTRRSQINSTARPSTMPAFSPAGASTHNGQSRNSRARRATLGASRPKASRWSAIAKSPPKANAGPRSTSPYICDGTTSKSSGCSTNHNKINHNSGGKKGKQNAFKPNQHDGRPIRERPNLAQRGHPRGRQRDADADPESHDDDLGAIHATEQNPNTDRQGGGADNFHGHRPAPSSPVIQVDVLDVAVSADNPGRISRRRSAIHKRP